MNNKRYFAVSTEYERGFGQKLWSVEEFLTEELAQKRVHEINSENTLYEAPDWYISARLSNDLNLTTSKDYVDCRNIKPRVRVKALSQKV